MTSTYLRPLLILLCLFSPALAQEPQLPVVRNQFPRLPPGIPPASIPGSPDEETWWAELRTHGEQVRNRKGGDKAKKRFAELLTEAHTKSFAVPIENRGPIFLYRAMPRYTEEARLRLISGTITLEVEFLANGTVGMVRPLTRLGAGLEENAESTARQFIFLPAVKDRKFVNFKTRVVMSFNIY